mgnify:CR=1 FL=1
MSFPQPFYRWRPHPWHGLETGIVALAGAALVAARTEAA